MDQVSVIILSYNNLNYLNQAIDSVFIQDYSNIQLIISDDASAEFDRESIENYIAENKGENITAYIVIGREQNSGTVQNINKALKLATGEFIVPLAADDVLYDKEVLKNFAKCFRQTETREDIITTQVLKYDLHLKQIMGESLSKENIKLLQSDDFSKIYGELALNCFIPSGGTAYRKNVFEEYSFFDEKYKLVEDWPYFLKLTKNKVKIIYGGFISVKHRDEGISSNTASKLKSQYQMDLIHIMEDEVLQNLSFAPLNMQKKILEQCRDKKIYYDLRFKFQFWTIWQKVQYLCRISTIVAVLRGIIRRIKRYEH